MRVEEAEAVTMRFYRGIPGIKIKLRRNWVVSLINWNPKNAPRSCFRGTHLEFKNHRLKVEKEG